MRYSKFAIFAASFSLMTNLAQAQESTTTITIGAHMPLTGAFARSGQSFNEGMQVAIKICNATSPKFKVNLEVIDDESIPSKAVSAVEKFISEGAVAIIGGYGSNIIGPASGAANNLGKVYVTAGAVSELLTQRGLRTFFRTNNNAGYLRGVSSFIASLKPTNGVSIVASTKEAPHLFAEELQKDLIANGIKVNNHSFDPSITDFKPIINKIKLQDKTDIMMIAGYENDHIGIIRAAKLLKPNIKLIVGVYSLVTPKMNIDFPELMNNVTGTAFLPFPVAMNSAEGNIFSSTYAKLYKKEVEYQAVLSYTASIVLCEAVVRAAEAGTLDSGGLVDEMRKTDRESLQGRIKFDQSGDNPYFEVSIGQHQTDKINLIWPNKIANGHVIYPGVPW